MSFLYMCFPIRVHYLFLSCCVCTNSDLHGVCDHCTSIHASLNIMKPTGNHLGSNVGHDDSRDTFIPSLVVRRHSAALDLSFRFACPAASGSPPDGFLVADNASISWLEDTSR